MPINSTTYSVNGSESPILLGSADWNSEWKRLQDMRRKKDSTDFWNKRSKDFDRPDKVSPYVQEFIARCALQSEDVVLDMGCGTGSIAVPLARAGHKVVAADFSEGMIGELRKRMQAAQVEGVTPLVMAWEDNWQEYGVGEKSVDVVLASRSLSVADLGEALDKMCVTARKKCAATMTCGCSPRMDSRILGICGLENKHGRDYQYAWNILTNRGYAPTCSFIYSLRKDTFETFEDAQKDFGRMLDDVSHFYTEDQMAQAYERLAAWLEAELMDNEEAGQIDEKGYPQGRLRLRQTRVIPWAYLEWSVE